MPFDDLPEGQTQHALSTDDASLGAVITSEQRAYAASILAYRLAQQHVERVEELHTHAMHMADVLRGRMEQARRELPN